MTSSLFAKCPFIWQWVSHLHICQVHLKKSLSFLLLVNLVNNQYFAFTMYHTRINIMISFGNRYKRSHWNWWYVNAIRNVWLLFQFNEQLNMRHTHTHTYTEGGMITPTQAYSHQMDPFLVFSTWKYFEHDVSKHNITLHGRNNTVK